MDAKQQKINTIRDLLAGRITASQIDDRIEVFIVDGKEVSYKVNSKKVDRGAFYLACLNNPKDPSKNLAFITVHGRKEINLALPEEYYV